MLLWWHFGLCFAYNICVAVGELHGSIFGAERVTRRWTHVCGKTTPPIDLVKSISMCAPVHALSYISAQESSFLRLLKDPSAYTVHPYSLDSPATSMKLCRNAWGLPCMFIHFLLIVFFMISYSFSFPLDNCFPVFHWWIFSNCWITHFFIFGVSLISCIHIYYRMWGLNHYNYCVF